MSDAQEILELRKELNQANFEYYVKDDPTMSDYDYDHKLRRLEELEQKSASPEFYDDAAASGAVFAEMGELKDRLEQYAALQTMLEDAETLLEMCAEDDDPALAEEADAAVNSLDAKVEELRLVTLLNGEYDANNAILTFHADRKSTRLNSSHIPLSRMPSSA